MHNILGWGDGPTRHDARGAPHCTIEEIFKTLDI
jgi:hypothetical protein